MPYARRYTRRRPTYRRRRYSRRQGRVATKRYVQSVVRKVSAPKHHDTNTPDLLPGTTEDIRLLSDFSEGDTSQTRDGLIIYPKAVYVRTHISTTNATNEMRIVFFQWFDENDAPTWTSLFAASTTSTAGLLQSFKWSSGASKRFKILGDYKVTLDSDTRNNLTKTWKFTKLKPISFLTSGTGGGGNGHIYCMAASDFAGDRDWETL